MLHCIRWQLSFKYRQNAIASPHTFDLTTMRWENTSIRGTGWHEMRGGHGGGRKYWQKNLVAKSLLLIRKQLLILLLDDSLGHIGYPDSDNLMLLWEKSDETRILSAWKNYISYLSNSVVNGDLLWLAYFQWIDLRFLMFLCSLLARVLTW